MYHDRFIFNISPTSSTSIKSNNFIAIRFEVAIFRKRPTNNYIIPYAPYTWNKSIFIFSQVYWSKEGNFYLSDICDDSSLKNFASHANHSCTFYRYEQVIGVVTCVHINSLQLQNIICNRHLFRWYICNISAFLNIILLFNSAATNLIFI